MTIIGIDPAEPGSEFTAVKCSCGAVSRWKDQRPAFCCSCKALFRYEDDLIAKASGEK